MLWHWWIWNVKRSCKSWLLRSQIYIYMCIAYRKNMLLFLAVWCAISSSRPGNTCAYLYGCCRTHGCIFSSLTMNPDGGWLMVAKKKCQKSSDQDFHMFQEYLSVYVPATIYIYIYVSGISISVQLYLMKLMKFIHVFFQSDHTVYLPASGSGPSSWRLKEA